MRKFIWQRFIVIAIIALALTGCLKSASSDDSSSPESGLLPSQTPAPTNTMIPPPSITPAPLVASPTSANPTFALPSQTPFPTSVQPVQQVVVEPTDAGPTAVLGSMDRLATRNAVLTQESINMTATAGSGFQVPTWTPTQDAFAVQPTAVSWQPGQDCYHEVVAKENMYALSMRYGLTVNQIAAANGVIDVEQISVGQMLRIPGCGTTGTLPPPTSTPTGQATDASSGQTVGLTPGLPTPTHSAGNISYIVQQGETLFQIALRYNVSVEAIVAANPQITDKDQIEFNDTIIIP